MWRTTRLFFCGAFLSFSSVTYGDYIEVFMPGDEERANSPACLSRFKRSVDAVATLLPGIGSPTKRLDFLAPAISTSNPFSPLSTGKHQTENMVVRSAYSDETGSGFTGYLALSHTNGMFNFENLRVQSQWTAKAGGLVVRLSDSSAPEAAKSVCGASAIYPNFSVESDSCGVSLSFYHPYPQQDACADTNYNFKSELTQLPLNTLVPNSFTLGTKNAQPYVVDVTDEAAVLAYFDDPDVETMSIVSIDTDGANIGLSQGPLTVSCTGVNPTADEYATAYPSVVNRNKVGRVLRARARLLTRTPTANMISDVSSLLSTANMQAACSLLGR